MDAFRCTELSEVLAAFRAGYRVSAVGLHLDGVPVWVLQKGKSPVELVLAIPRAWTLPLTD
jgi:hypothetical protein